MDRFFLALIVGSLIALVATLAVNIPPVDTSAPALMMKERAKPPLTGPAADRYLIKPLAKDFNNLAQPDDVLSNHFAPLLLLASIAAGCRLIVRLVARCAHVAGYPRNDRGPLT